VAFAYRSQQRNWIITATLFAIFSTRVFAVPTFHPVGEDPNRAPPVARLAPQADGSQILAQLGSSSTNVGDFQGSFFSDKVTQALRYACPNASMQTCGPSQSNITVPTCRLVGNYNAQNTLLSEDLHVKVTSASWDGQRETYDVLINAVAGIAV
jgi:hypothetical protein